jgi:polysaccharide export outer membrane protein
MTRIRNLSFVRSLFGLRVTSGIVLSLFMVVLWGPVAAQEKVSENPPSTASTVASTPASTGAVIAITRADERYRIGPGDVLDIRVFNRPQLSREAVRVDSYGMIQMPLIEADIRAACLSENELAAQIATLYKKYQRNPYVNVFIK